MPGVRRNWLIAVIGFAVLVAPRVAAAGDIIDVNKPVPGADMTVTPSLEGDSQPTMASPPDADAKAAPIPATTAAPASNDKSEDLSHQAGSPTPAAEANGPTPDGATPVAATPTANADTPSTSPAAPAATSHDNPQSPAPANSLPATPAPSSAPSQPAATDAGAAAGPDAPITAQLRELANGKFDHTIGSPKVSASIDAFYSHRNYAPLWITDGKANARAKAAIAYLGAVSADGLDPADYPVPNFAALTDPGELAEAEIVLTTSVITYAHHAQVGRVHWSRVSGDISYERSAPDPDEVLTTLAEATDVAAALDAYEPHAEGYLALKAKLAELRGGQHEVDKAQIPNGQPLKVGMRDERVPLLRLRLEVDGGSDTTYDKALSEAVKKFQLTHKLKPTGALDTATVESLNGRHSDRQTEILIANMERWRWMPHDLGNTYVIVNLVDYTLRVIHQGKQVWMTRIVVGKPSTPTPIMSAQMRSITVNPTWNVPESIAENEYLPLLRQDPTILQRMGLRVTYNTDGSIHLSQPPGEQNALGQLRFNFPNKFLVYQHDSNQKYLFANEKRDDSHGCMRVQDPVKYAEVLLSLVRPAEGYTQDRIRRMFGNNEIDLSFPNLIPVHLTYQTAFVDERGKLEFREDIYGRDQALLAILKGPERKVADTPIQRNESTIRRQVLAMPDSGWGGWGWSGRGYPGVPNFFTRWLGGPSDQPARAARRPVAQHRAYYQ
jgi:L,D-transpeptidase YcbB